MVHDEAPDEPANVPTGHDVHSVVAPPGVAGTPAEYVPELQMKHRKPAA